MGISTTGEWRAVEASAASTGETTLRELYDRGPHRGSRTRFLHHRPHRP
ncbi:MULTISPECIES: hypothetical protein [Dietzia]|nr:MULTISPECIES: hypothetical protein [Dietzia]MBB1017236.1 hypothetical protein [Dietzia sp. DQ11-71]USX45099.1 hypothetical protein NHB83_12725 [Dietzia kunjamensis]